VHAHHHRRRGVDTRDLLESDEIRERVEPEAVILLGDQHTEKPELAEFLNERRLEVRVAIPLRAVRRDLVLGEVVGETLNLALIFGERSECPSHMTSGASHHSNQPTQYA